MPQNRQLIRSINLDGEMQCVDFFRFSNGTFGFELFRREPEDVRGWFPIGYFDGAEYKTEAAAIEAACDNVPWLAEKIAIQDKQAVKKPRGLDAENVHKKDG